MVWTGPLGPWGLSQSLVGADSAPLPVPIVTLLPASPGGSSCREREPLPPGEARGVQTQRSPLLPGSACAQVPGTQCPRPRTTGVAGPPTFPVSLGRLLCVFITHWFRLELLPQVLGFAAISALVQRGRRAVLQSPDGEVPLLSWGPLSVRLKS